MHVYEMVVLIVAITVVGRIIRSYLNRGKPDEPRTMGENIRANMRHGSDYYTRKKLDPYLEKIATLEQRIQVLERIATDKSHNLADEIDNLK